MNSAAEKLPENDALEAVRAKAAEAREAEFELESLEERVRDLKKRLETIYEEDLPILMDEAGVDRIGIPAHGNLPAMDAKLSPFFSANIAANWDAERRNAAFRWLEANGSGDLIKTEVAVAFPRGKHEEAKSLAEELSAKGIAPTFKETVHSQTLTAWLREQLESGAELPPLETIGGYIGRIVSLKPRKG